MDKKNMLKIIIIPIGIILLILLIGVGFGIPMGSRCGYHSAWSSESIDCGCIGIKTGGCAILLGGSCDKWYSSCLGIKTSCYQTNYNRTDNTNTKEKIICQ